jgi:pimeloyl-ACP methyl ester carboxylesterase
VVEIGAGDGARLRASLFMPEHWNSGAVLILHGISDSRGSEIGFAHLFLARGYVVLTPDNRAQGESGGNYVTYGVLEAGDVHRWVSWLIAERHPGKIFGLGESLGGAVLIQSLAVEPRFSAIVAECSYSSLERLARDRVAQRLPLPREVGRMLAAPVVWAAFAYARLRYGLDFRNASPEAAVARSSTPVLLIHGLNDTKTSPEHSGILAASNPQSTTLWLVPGAGHTGAYAAAPSEFEHRVLDFYQNLPRGIQAREK